MAFLVVVIHVNAYFLNFEEEITTVVVIVENFINVITRIAVPGFFMLSGALVLHGASINNPVVFYKNAIYKILIPFWMIYLFWGTWYTVKSFGNSEPFVTIVSIWLRCTFGNLWFMPVLCAIYLIAPLLNHFRRAFGNYIFEIVNYFLQRHNAK